MARLALAGATAHVFVESLADALTIAGADGHHLGRVLRLRAGDAVTAADGTGSWRSYAVRVARKGELDLDATAAIAREPTATPGLVGAVAVLPRARLERVVAPLSELGVDELVLVTSERVQAGVDERVVDRLRVLARESAMQARRARPLVVSGPVALTALAGRGDVVLADARGEPATAIRAPAPGRAWVVVSGPEGGFGPRDRAALGDTPRLCLGPQVLRAEHAAIAAAAVLTQRRAMPSAE